MNPVHIPLCYAFARGYWDGRSEGVENNPYDGGKDDAQMHQAYKYGYDWGVSDYCTEAHPEDINN
jgi:hypothetical protein